MTKSSVTAIVLGVLLKLLAVWEITDHCWLEMPFFKPFAKGTDFAQKKEPFSMLLLLCSCPCPFFLTGMFLFLCCGSALSRLQSTTACYLLFAQPHLWVPLCPQYPAQSLRTADTWEVNENERKQRLWRPSTNNRPLIQRISSVLQTSLCSSFYLTFYFKGHSDRNHTLSFVFLLC